MKSKIQAKQLITQIQSNTLFKNMNGVGTIIVRHTEEAQNDMRVLSLKNERVIYLLAVQLWAEINQFRRLQSQNNLSDLR